MTDMKYRAWVSWHGGERPVSPDTWVEVYPRQGLDLIGKASRFDWSSTNILRYRLCAPDEYHDPKPPQPEKLSGGALDSARWSRAYDTHPDNYACAGIEAARLARVGWEPGMTWEEEARALFEDIRATYRGCSPGSREENLWHRISLLLKEDKR